jgi:hypothetical protein
MVLISEEDSAVSPLNGNAMKNIGFVEKNDSEKTDMIKFLVDSAKGINLSKMNKEEDPMTEENTVAAESAVVEKSEEIAPEAETVVETVDSVMEKADEAEVAKTADMDEDEMEEKADNAETEEKSADMKDEEEDDKSYDEKSDNSETVVDAAEVSKSDDVNIAVAELQSGIASAFSDLSAVVKSLNDQVAELKKSLDGASAEIKSVKDEVNASKSDFNEFGKRFEAVEADTAFRKSGDLGEVVQESESDMVQKSLWGGRFLKTADLFN